MGKARYNRASVGNIVIFVSKIMNMYSENVRKSCQFAEKVFEVT
jgi:hypothetical protein